jgi:predicted anti-sigma-YlaC factor YlaD
MHRLIEQHLEEALSKKSLPSNHPAQRHLDECADCRTEVETMREHSALLRNLAPPGEMDPRPGFYARVWERIEAQRPVSIWNLFTESLWGRRLATASLSLALLMGAYVISTERSMRPVRQDTMARQLLPDAPVLAAVNSSPNAVFMELVSYQGR